jgi:phosphonate transport system substrate-binding protein
LIAPLKFASCMAENSETFCYELVAYVHAECGIPMHYVTGIPWQEREQLFDDGEIKILWLCGLPCPQSRRAQD